MADLQRKTPLLHDNPLCGISTYKDTLNLATGACTRQIRKYELTGGEDITYQSTYSRFYFILADAYYTGTVRTTPCNCSHYQSIHDGRAIDEIPNESIYVTTAYDKTAFNIKTTDFTDATEFKSYLQQQYAAGTPVTIWYILAEPTTETITVPSGLFGTEEGYLNQSGTPTPTNPIYPTANIVEIWQHSLRKLTSNGWQEASVKECDGSNWR